MTRPHMQSAHKVLIFFAMCFSMALVRAEGLDGLWRLRVLDMDHQIKVAATIRFSALSAPSCMGNEWKRVVVVAKTADDEGFFPLAQSLAYQLDGGALTLGRAQMCDAYLLLQAKSVGSAMKGEFSAVGWGTRKLGYFTLEKLQYRR